MAHLENCKFEPFLVYVDDKVADEVYFDLKHEFENLSRSRTWGIGRLEFIDEFDLAARFTLGAELRIAHGLDDKFLPLEIDRRHFGEVADIVRLAQELSIKYQLTFQFELGGQPIGRISNGEMDSRLDEQFLKQWRQALALRLEHAPPMLSIDDLLKELQNRGVPDQDYAILAFGTGGGNGELFIRGNVSKWTVGRSERGTPFDTHDFSSEDAACKHFLKEMFGG